MRKYLWIGVIGSVAAAYMMSCGDSSTKPVVENPPQTEWQFTIAEGESAYVAEADRYVKFWGVTEDYRCPLTEICSWPGFAELYLLWTPPNAVPTTSMLMSLLGAPDDESIEDFKQQVGDYTFRLLQLDPPRVNSNLTYRGYAATIRITKGEKKSTITAKVRLGGLPPDYSLRLGSPFYFKHEQMIGDTLQVALNMSTMSDSPEYLAYMDPPTFAATWPPSANIHFRTFIQHAAEDVFDSVVTRFDLSEILKLYRKKYGSSGRLMLNLYSNLDGGYTSYGLRAKLIYDPSGSKVNWAPEFIPILAETLNVGYDYMVPFHYYDPNGTDLVAQVDGLPVGAKVVRDNNFPDQLYIGAKHDNVGQYRVRFTTTDGELADTMFWELTIAE